MRRKIDILHIYAGTSGSSGLYLDEIFKSLSDTFKQRVIVNYHFPFDYGMKIFYRFTDLSIVENYKIIKRYRTFFRSIEFIFGLIYSFIYILINRPDIVNYSLISSFKIEYIYFYFIKKFSNSKLLLTCHDVIPFKHAYSTFDSDLKLRKKMLTIADFLIIHNKTTVPDLKKAFDVDADKIIIYPFPIMDIKKMFSHQSSRSDSITRYTFVGHLRSEKGINTLIDAWDDFYNSNKQAELVIAGNIPKGDKIDFSKITNKNVILIKNYISDLDYYNLIVTSDFILLPYSRGTNSGFPSTVLSVERLVISSDIPMFRDSICIHPDLKFVAGDYKSLSDRLRYAYELKSSERQSLIDELKNNYTLYQKNFNTEIKEAYKKILNQK